MTAALPVHEVRYEDMHAAPMETARQLFRFRGIPASDALIAELLDQVHFSKLPQTGPQEFRRAGRVGDWVTEGTTSSGCCSRLRPVRCSRSAGTRRR